MSNDYQAVYDATREALGNLDHHLQVIAQDICLQVALTQEAMRAPHLLLKCAVNTSPYTPGLWTCTCPSVNILGRGSTPAAAAEDFDRQWKTGS